MVLSASLADFE